MDEFFGFDLDCVGAGSKSAPVWVNSWQSRVGRAVRRRSVLWSCLAAAEQSWRKEKDQGPYRVTALSHTVQHGHSSTLMALLTVYILMLCRL